MEENSCWENLLEKLEGKTTTKTISGQFDDNDAADITKLHEKCSNEKRFLS